MRKIRYLDKLVDELAKGKSMGQSPAGPTVIRFDEADLVVRSDDGLRLFMPRFRGWQFAEHLPNHLVGVRLVMPEGQKVSPQRLTGHLEFLIGENDGVHATILVLLTVSACPRSRTIRPAVAPGAGRRTIRLERPRCVPLP